MIDEVAYNGTLIIETLVRNITYQSKLCVKCKYVYVKYHYKYYVKQCNLCIGITGATIKLDNNGDSEGNYSVVALKMHDFQYHLAEGNFSCPYYMIPVAQFYHGELLVRIQNLVINCILFLNVKLLIIICKCRSTN